MAEVTLQNPAAYFADPRKGKPVYNGSIYIGEPDSDPKIEANRVDIAIIQEDGTRVPILPAMQPLLTGAGGKILYQGSTVTVKITDAVSMLVVDAVGVEIEYFPRLNELTAASIGGTGGEAPVNGSFETEIAAGVPANWLIVVGAGSVTVDTTESAHGVKSLRFTGVDGTGGGTARSDRFNVAEGGDVDVRFLYRSTAPTTRNELSVRYYGITGALLFIDTVHSDAATNPLVYTPYLYRSTAPALAIQADIFIDGVNPAGATVVGSTYFDGVFVDYLSGDESVGAGGSVIDIVDVPNSVNNLTISSAATGDKPSIDQIGEDVGVDIEGVELKNGVVTASLAGNADTASGLSGSNLTGDVSNIGNAIKITPINGNQLHGGFSSFSGTTTATTANKLEDNSETFITKRVGIGSTVFNTTDGTITTVLAVDSETVLSVATDIFSLSDNYTIGADYVMAIGASQVSTALTTYTKTHEIRTPYAGSFSIIFDLASGAAVDANARIYINNVAIGTERSNATTVFVTQPAESITVNAGDMIQLWAKGTTDVSIVRNFAIREAAPVTEFIVTL